MELAIHRNWPCPHEAALTAFEVREDSNAAYQALVEAEMDAIEEDGDLMHDCAEEVTSLYPERAEGLLIALHRAGLLAETTIHGPLLADAMEQEIRRLAEKRIQARADR